VPPPHGQGPGVRDVRRARLETPPPRSEERRVGKECRSRWPSQPINKKMSMLEQEDTRLNQPRRVTSTQTDTSSSSTALGTTETQPHKKKSITAQQQFFFSSRRRHTRFSRDWSSDVCSSDLFRRRTDKGLEFATFDVPGWKRRL